MKQIFLKNSNLQNYRNFSELSLDFAEYINIIVGENGAGKTNLLESISLLSPGKGLKSAHFDDICKSSSNFWKSKFDLQSKLGSANIDTSFSKLEKSRKMTYNGSKIPSNELSNLLNVVWLTPQMEGLFLGSSTSRRRFLDRIVFNFDLRHLKRITQYEHFVRERNKILSHQNFLAESSWLTTLEEKIAIEASSINSSRSEAIILMQKAIDSLDTNFPKAILKISKLFEEPIENDNFIEKYVVILAKNRQKDSYSGRTNFGIHKTDLLVFHAHEERAAYLCSTGEQKALLISVILASIEFILQNTQTTPILLLDELFIHLDSLRKKYLVDYIIKSKLQTFITTTDMIGIEELAKIAHIIDL